MSEDIKAIFSKNLSNQLYAHSKTQADICKHMNVSSATASDWCNGKKLPRLDKIQSLCNWFGIEKSDLLEDKNSFKERDIAVLEAQENVSNAKKVLEDMSKHLTEKKANDLYQLFSAYENLTEKNQEMIRNLMDSLAQKGEPGKEDK